MKQHLSIKSHFSIGESLLKIGDIVSEAQALGYEALALTDTNSLHGMVEFTQKCHKAGIKPITAVTLLIHDDPLYKKAARTKDAKNSPYFALKVYVLNEKGFSWLLKALSLANSEGRYYYHARSGIDDFKDAEGIAVSTGDLFGLFGHPEWKTKLAALVGYLGGENVYLELAPIDTPLFDTVNARAIEAGIATNHPYLLTYPARYKAGDAAACSVLSLVTTGGKIGEPWNKTQYVQDFHLQEPKHINARIMASCKRIAMFGGTADAKVWMHAMRGTQELTDRVTFAFSKMPVNLPQMAPDEFEAMKTECGKGWRTRFSAPVLGDLPDMANPDVKKQYAERLMFELSVIGKMNFSGYFLLAQTITNFCKRNGIIVGPGRGSVGGSLVAYLLGITDVDPIRFGLLFERFINPDRIDLPDADLDFMSSRRHEVIEFLQKTFGRDHVAGISNYSSMASSSAMRDAGRIHGLSNLDLVPMKQVPKEHGQPVTLTEAAKQVAEIEQFSLDHPNVWKHGLAFEGVMRSFGQHAAGVVVSRDPTSSRAVVETRTEMPVVCWDKSNVEDFGLVKLDILGLSTLDVLALAKGHIKTRHGIDLAYLDIPLGEADIMESFGRGDTTGVFQFESSGMRELLRNLAKGGLLTFEDITAATALYRPGPMDSGLLDDFVNIKKGDLLPSYEHPLMESALKETYSVIVYQEQVMQLAVDLAGFTRTEADHLRKAMGKKDKDKMAKMRDQWVDGCHKTAGMEAKRAGLLFDKIEAFAGYGFNKSHAVEYSVISYWTMWLRVRYPAEYFAACMSIVDQEKLPGLVRDARAYGIEIYPPDINHSTNSFAIASDKIIVAPFNAILGVSETIAGKIVELREKQPTGRFDTPEQFKKAAGAVGTKVNSRVVERLDAVGALANITPGAKPPRHPDRRKEQTELMPGLIIDAVKADRYTDMTEGFTKAKIIHIVQAYSKCGDCSLKGNPHPMIRIPASKCLFMVVSDCPSWPEEKAGRLLEGDGADFLKTAITSNALVVGNGYYTSVVKSKKDDKFLSNEQINGCKKYIDQELEIIKPPVIIALGSAAIRFFLPDAKGGVGELAGKVFYDPKRQASIVCGINPAQIIFDPDKLDVLKDTFAKVAEIVL